MSDKTTPLFEKHQDLGARCAPFAGWQMPIQYKGIIAEHEWTRSSCSVFDICHMGEFMVRGDKAAAGLVSILTASLENMNPGQCRYGFMLNERGGVIDDVVTYRLNEADWMLVVNAGTRAKDLDHLKAGLEAVKGVEIEDVSDRTGKIDVQGPVSLDVLTPHVDPPIVFLGYYTFIKTKFDGMDVIISRTGYTGELGYEIYCDSRDIVKIWKTLIADERVMPAGLGARDTLRLEMGYPLYGHELDEEHTPLEAGLERFLNWDKEFIGKPALLKQKAAKVREQLVCFACESRRSPRHGFELTAEGRRVGKVTSGSFSPSLGQGIGMGYVEEKFSADNTVLDIEGERFSLACRVRPRPFYGNGSARKKF